MNLADSSNGDAKEKEIPRPPAPPTFHPLSAEILTLLMPMSVFGVLARLGLSALTTDNGQSIFPLIYAQAVGCLIMGFCLDLKEPFSRYYPQAYTALTTGFCGSLTTFSGWELDIFKSWVNDGSISRSGLSSAIDGICKTVFTISVCVSSLFYGMHLANLALPYFRAPQPPSKTIRRAMSAISVLIYAATIPAYFLLPSSFRHQATAALVFSYPGTLTRYLLGTYLNPIIASFPLGTFVANISGTALLATFHVLQSISSHPLSTNSCNILQGLADGYCGCLTTISTLTAEVATLKTAGHKYRYGLITWVTGQLILTLIFGTLLWVGDISKQQTCVFG